MTGGAGSADYASLQVVWPVSPLVPAVALRLRGADQGAVPRKIKAGLGWRRRPARRGSRSWCLMLKVPIVLQCDGIFTLKPLQAAVGPRPSAVWRQINLDTFLKCIFNPDVNQTRHLFSVEC